MPTYIPLTPVPIQLQDLSTSLNMAGGTLEFYLSGTNTPTNLFSDNAGSSIGTSITLNAGGMPEAGGNIITLFRDAAIDLKIIGKDAAGVTLFTSDGLSAPTASGILITDSAGAFAAVTVEDALLEAKGIIKTKTGDTSRSSNTTLADDAHLAAWSLAANARYIVEGFIPYTQDGGDVKFTFQFSQTPQETHCTFFAVDTAGTVAADHGDLTTTFAITTLADAADAGITFRGSILTNLTLSSVMDFQWAQNSSDADATTLENGGWIRVTRVS